MSFCCFGVGVAVAVGVGVEVDVAVAVGVGDSVGVVVLVGEGELVAVAIDERVDSTERVGSLVAVAVAGCGVDVAAWVGVVLIVGDAMDAGVAVKSVGVGVAGMDVVGTGVEVSAAISATGVMRGGNKMTKASRVFPKT